MEKNIIEYKKTINTNLTKDIIVNTNLSKNIIVNNNLNKDTIVNYSCFCSKCFYANEKLLYILPCCHIVHENCFNNYIIKTQYKNLNIHNNSNNIKSFFLLNCPFCMIKIKTVLSDEINETNEINEITI